VPVSDTPGSRTQPAFPPPAYVLMATEKTSVPPPRMLSQTDSARLLVASGACGGVCGAYLCGIYYWHYGGLPLAPLILGGSVLFALIGSLVGIVAGASEGPGHRFMFTSDDKEEVGSPRFARELVEVQAHVPSGIQPVEPVLIARGQMLVIGAQASDDLALASQHAWGQRASLLWRSGRLLLDPEGSPNTIEVDGRQVREEVELFVGSKFRLGRYRFRCIEPVD
jgi:hypothetical protein